MKRFSWAIVPIATAIMLTITSTLYADLTEYRWKNRLLLVFSPHASNPGFVTLDESLKKMRLEVTDRDLIVFRVFENETSLIEEKKLPEEDANGLRRRYSIQPGQLIVILIGKDGGVKLVRERHADIHDIFDLIDSMPMRLKEIRRKGRSP